MIIEQDLNKLLVNIDEKDSQINALTHTINELLDANIKMKAAIVSLQKKLVILEGKANDVKNNASNEIINNNSADIVNHVNATSCDTSLDVESSIPQDASNDMQDGA